jgi:hypothetical protein
MEQDGSVKSAAVAEFWDATGTEIDYTIRLGGGHYIDATDGYYSEIEAFLSTPGHYANLLHLGISSLGHCWRSRLVVDADDSQTSHGEWQSAFPVCNNQTPPEEPPGCGCTPILLDLDGNGLHLTDTSDPVSFDIDGDGLIDQQAWTAAGQSDAFLALDRDGDGLITSGRELFGDSTPMASGVKAANGYEALFEYDRLSRGGNEDGLVNSGDSVFVSLLVWLDGNRNGVTDAGELSSVINAGVLSFECQYSERRRHDRYGNTFRYQGRAWVTNPAGLPRAAPTYDVLFKLAE